MDKPWEYVYLALTVQGFMMGDWGNANGVWGAYLKYKGFHKYPIPDFCPDCYTVSDFCRDYSTGTFVVGTGNHVVCVKDGDYYDAWDSGREVPVFYFRKEN